MVNCAFCGLGIDKGNPGFTNPSEQSQAAKQVWLKCAKNYLTKKKKNNTELTENDRVCRSHFADDAKRLAGKLWKLEENAVPTVSVDNSGPSILPQPKIRKKYPINPPVQTPKTRQTTMLNSPAKVNNEPSQKNKVKILSIEISQKENIEDVKIQDCNTNEIVDSEIVYEIADEVCEAAAGIKGVNDKVIDAAGQVDREENEDLEYVNTECLDEYGELEEPTGNGGDDLEATLSQEEVLSDGETSVGGENTTRVSEGTLKNGKKRGKLTEMPAIESPLGKMAHKRKHNSK